MTSFACEHALRHASRLLPRASCLARAIAGACLLRREGHDATLTIGVRFDSDHRLHAHAWLESGGRIVAGGHEPHAHRILLRDVI
jgi:Transglutaminase-like superfamily